MNITAELLVIHFERLLDFFFEVRRGLGDDVECRDIELLVVAYRGILE